MSYTKDSKIDRASQNAILIRLMKRKWVSTMDAYVIGITRFGARINDIRKMGYQLEEKWLVENGKRFKKLRIKK